MRRLSQRFDAPGTVVFLPWSDAAPDGAPDPRYPPLESGEVVNASVQGYAGKRYLAQGVDAYEVEFTVTLLDDPSGLNGGRGVKRGDAFVWSLDGRYMVARHDAVPVGSCWPVRCLVNET